MDVEIRRFIASTFLGNLCQVGNMGVVALYYSHEVGRDYLTLSDALIREELAVQELDRNGSGPTLQVTNFSQFDVLVAEGEELSGQTHRKLLDRTVLLRGESKTLMQVNPSDQKTKQSKRKLGQKDGIDANGSDCPAIAVPPPGSQVPLALGRHLARGHAALTERSPPLSTDYTDDTDDDGRGKRGEGRGKREERKQQTAGVSPVVP